MRRTLIILAACAALLPARLLFAQSDLTITSQPSILVTNPATGTWPPLNGTNNSGQNVLIPVIATASRPITYQWQRSGTNLVENASYVGTTTATLSLPVVTANQAGVYRVVVGDGLTNITSSPVTVAVYSPIPTFPGRKVYDLQTQFNSGGAGPGGVTPDGWRYCNGLAYDHSANISPGGLALTSFINGVIDPNWNSGDFTPGQPGYDGDSNPGPHAGWAQRVDNGSIDSTPNGNKDSLPGMIIGYKNSAMWVAPSNLPPGTVHLTGGIWNLRHFGRGGAWRIWHNDGNVTLPFLPTPLTQGAIQDTSGSSEGPFSFDQGSGGPSALRNILYSPGDTFRVDSDNEDFEGWQFTVWVSTNLGIKVFPQSQFAAPGTNITLTVVASGIAPFSYQWQFYGTNLPGATTTALVLNNLTAAQEGPYVVVVTNSSGSVSTPPAILTPPGLYVASGPAPFLVTNFATGQWAPQGGMFNSGEKVFSTVVAGGSGPFTYQWILNGADVAGQTNATLLIAAKTNLAGNWTVRINTATNTVTSAQAAVLAVNAPIAVPPGIPHDMQKQFNTSANPTPEGWEYRTGLGFADILLAPFDPNWNSADYGAGQPGWDGVAPGPWAGWAQRVDNGTIGNTGNGNKDAPLGSIVGYRNSVLWRVPDTDLGGIAYIAGGVWNNRHFGRGGTWSIYYNDGGNASATPLTQGANADFLGDSDGPMSFDLGNNGPSPLRGIHYSPGDTFRFNDDMDDFVGVQFTIYTLSDPGFYTPPQDQTVQVNSTVTFSFVTNGTAPFTYQWQFYGTNLPGATGTSLVLNNVQTNQSGPYTAIIMNSKGTNSATAILTVLAQLYIVTQPHDLNLNFGTTGSVSVVAGGIPPFTYQWAKNGNNISGATDSTYTIIGSNTNLSGQYSVVIHNGTGLTVTAGPAVVSVFPPIPVYAGYPHDVQNEFSSLANPTPHDWQYSESLANGGGSIQPSVYIANWNSPDFGNGQPGWQGGIPGPHAGYAKRVDNGTIGNTPNGNKDAPVGTIMTHGPTSVMWTAGTGDPGGVANIAGGLWNLRHFGRSGQWNLYKNDGTILSSGNVDDNSGSSFSPMSLDRGSGGPSALQNISYAAGDTFRLELLEGDFQGIKFTVYTLTDPMITNQPPETLLVGAAAPFHITVGATGSTALSYQWVKDGSNISGQTTSTLTVANPTPNNNGNYWVVVTNTHGSIRSYPTVVTVDTNPPVIVSAMRPLLPVTQVNVVFSKTLNPSTATNINNYSINNGVTVSGATLSSDRQTVVLTTSLISGSVTNTLTVNGVQDSLGNSIAANSQVTISAGKDITRTQDNSADHLLVLEAEDFNQNLSPSADGHNWVFTTTPALLGPGDTNKTFSGTGVMEAQPDSGANTGSTTSGPELDYKVNFVATGPQYIWIRGVGDSAPGPSGSDSIQIGIDGTLTAMFTGFPQGAGYTWSDTPQTFANPIMINAPGVHIINVWMREDGFGFDKLLITPNSGYTPTGVGPPESPIAGPAITVTRSSGHLILSWFGSGTLQSAANVTGPFADVSGASNPYQVTPTGTRQFFRVRP